MRSPEVAEPRGDYGWPEQLVFTLCTTIVMDLEGTDGAERGEDDTAFEKWSALFALAVADILIINMWCQDIGREHAANKPLLQTVFQVMTSLLPSRRATLLFVIRDKNPTPVAILERKLKEATQKLWESVPRSETFEGVLEDFFNVEVTILSHYFLQRSDFVEEVDILRERFNDSIARGGIAGDRREFVTGSRFPAHTRSIWEQIKENKDLNLPTYKVMVATVRCDEIAHEKLSEFLQNEKWIALKESAEAGVVPDFGKELNSSLSKLISEYDREVLYFDKNVRKRKYDYLILEVLKNVTPVHEAILHHLRTGVFNRFKEGLHEWADLQGREGESFSAAVRKFSEGALLDFDKGVADAKVTCAQWDTSKLREKRKRRIDADVSVVRNKKIGAIVSEAEKGLLKNIEQPTSTFLLSASPDME